MVSAGHRRFRSPPSHMKVQPAADDHQDLNPPGGCGKWCNLWARRAFALQFDAALRRKQFACMAGSDREFPSFVPAIDPGSCRLLPVFDLSDLGLREFGKRGNPASANYYHQGRKYLLILRVHHCCRSVRAAARELVAVVRNKPFCVLSAKRGRWRLFPSVSEDLFQTTPIAAEKVSMNALERRLLPHHMGRPCCTPRISAHPRTKTPTIG